MSDTSSKAASQAAKLGPPFSPSGQYQVDATYWGNDTNLTTKVAADAPYLIAPNAQFAKDIAVRIRSLYQIPGSGSPLPAVAGNADFKLAWSETDPKKVTPDNADNITLTITIAGAGNAWNVAPAARQALRANYADFCAQVETLELGTQALIPGGAGVVAQRVAEALPTAIGESLLFRSGFNPGFGLNNCPYVDLQPGMRLRVDFAANQFVGPASPLNGLVGSGQFYFAIGRDNDQRIVFDTFLSAISAPETSAPLGQATASGAIDLQAAGAPRRHYRLFYPTQLPPATAPGDARLSRNVVLVGADTLPDLRTATDAYTQAGAFGAAAPGNLPLIALGFRGRAIAVPEIPVYVNRQAGNLSYGALTYVPVGTTLRQLLDQQAGAWNAGLLYGDSSQIILRRFWAEDDGVPRYRRVKLNPSRQTDIRVFDLPLARSDILNIQFTMDN